MNNVTTVFTRHIPIRYIDGKGFLRRMHVQVDLKDSDTGRGKELIQSTARALHQTSFWCLLDQDVEVLKTKLGSISSVLAQIETEAMSFLITVNAFPPTGIERVRNEETGRTDCILCSIEEHFRKSFIQDYGADAGIELLITENTFYDNVVRNRYDRGDLFPTTVFEFDSIEGAPSIVYERVMYTDNPEHPDTTYLIKGGFAQFQRDASVHQAEASNALEYMLDKICKRTLISSMEAYIKGEDID